MPCLALPQRTSGRWAPRHHNTRPFRAHSFVEGALGNGRTACGLVHEGLPVTELRESGEQITPGGPMAVPPTPPHPQFETPTSPRPDARPTAFVRMIAQLSATGRDDRPVSALKRSDPAAPTQSQRVQG